MKIGLSACLVGIKCRYNGYACSEELTNLNLTKLDYYPFCPELLGGLPTPRSPLEIQGQIITNSYDDLSQGLIKVVDNLGQDYSQAMIVGARKTVELLKQYQITEVILKDKSPSCGYQVIYDGSFSGQLIAGQGILAALLVKEGFKIQNTG